MLVASRRWHRDGPTGDVLVLANLAYRSYSSYTIRAPWTGMWEVRFNSNWIGCDPRSAAKQERRVHLASGASTAGPSVSISGLVPAGGGGGDRVRLLSSSTPSRAQGPGRSVLQRRKDRHRSAATWPDAPGVAVGDLRLVSPPMSRRLTRIRSHEAQNRENARPMARCFVTRVLPGPALDRLQDRHEVDLWPDRMPPSYEELAARAAGAEGLLTTLTDRVDAALLEHCPYIRVISNYAVGHDNIDLHAAAARSIVVGNTPDVLTEATADLTFALLLAAARKLPEAIASVREGEWVTWEPGQHLGHAVAGATLGIVGLGRIGAAVAQRALGFNMTVLYTGGGPGSAAVRRVPLDRLLEESDFVTLHCPLTAATYRLIDADALGRMRASAILINTARGPIIDHQALGEALVAGQIAGAALDVTDPEPLPPDDPLLSTPNLIVVPHIGSATRVAREQMAELAVENLLAGLDGRPLPHEVRVAV